MKLGLISLVIVIGVLMLIFVGKDGAEKLTEAEISKMIRDKIEANSENLPAQNYAGTIPEAVDVEYEMVFIKGGEFLMGSPVEEQGRDSDEGPQHRVRVGDFWLGKYEVNWVQYSAFWHAVRENYDSNLDMNQQKRDLELHELISAPSQMWVPDGASLDLGMGFSDEHPAVRMTQFGAKKFCQWLSAQTGHFYRLPTEAEWEYACRAGTTGPYSCDAIDLADYAVLDPDQSRVAYAKIGTKKPNPWGLHDMHGNVFEWVCDRYDSETYQTRIDSENDFTDPIVWSGKRARKVMRGGSWYDPAEELRSGNRELFDPAILDPGGGSESNWWIPDAVWLGFRIVRPVEYPSAEIMHQFWN